MLSVSDRLSPRGSLVLSVHILVSINKTEIMIEDLVWPQLARFFYDSFCTSMLAYMLHFLFAFKTASCLFV